MKEDIRRFIVRKFKENNKDTAILGVSGGIDSAVVYYLLKDVIKIKAIHLPYEDSDGDVLNYINPERIINIKSSVDTIVKNTLTTDKIRTGNIMARVRMIYLYDIAKLYDGLVLGTENKSEYELGYYTRFGDEACDIQVINHLYKTEVYELAKEIGVPKAFIEKQPSAGLWAGQEDEKELGFTYKDADKILKRLNSVSWKQRVPYQMKEVSDY